MTPIVPELAHQRWARPRALWRRIQRFHERAKPNMAEIAENGHLAPIVLGNSAASNSILRREAHVRAW